ncbi:MAG: lipopolysaccharide biosynthesis protein [Candidatus Omnitrophota bacterium]|nr:MAG: lipopolysaccharide biosynthesis protein [Candidatus Omnitrophota bacterium]
MLIKVAVLARLLSPRDFGLFGIVTLTVMTLREFSETGMHLSLIHKKENTEQYLDTAWTLGIVRGLAMGIVLFFLAPTISWFFQEPRVTPLLQVMSGYFMLLGFTNIGIVYFKKELRFHKHFIFEIINATSSLLVGIFLAYKLRSVWALVFAELTWIAMRFLLSYVMHPYRPSWDLDFSKAKELLHYGKWILATTVTVWLITHFDHLMVGKFLGASALGFYAVAYKFSLVSMQEIKFTLIRVVFPGYAKIQADKDRLKRGFDRIFQLVTFLSIPICVGVILVAPYFVRNVLGGKWEGSILPLQILMLAQLIKIITSTGTPIFLGVGKPKYDFYMQLAGGITLLVVIYPFIKWFKLAGVSWAVVASAAMMLLPFLLGARKVSQLKIREFGARLLLPILSVFLMTPFVIYILSYIENKPTNVTISMIQLVGLVIAGALIYFSCAYALSKKLRFVTIAKDLKEVFRVISSQFRVKEGD